jgi:hypothetical protein
MSLSALIEKGIDSGTNRGTQYVFWGVGGDLKAPAHCDE